MSVLTSEKEVVTILYQRACMIVANIPDGLKKGDGTPITLTSHHVARVVAASNICYRVVDGHIMRIHEHSWLATPSRDLIIDPYPEHIHVHASGPLLISLAAGAPMSTVYSAIDQPKAISARGFEEEVRMLLEAATGKHRKLPKLET